MRRLIASTFLVCAVCAWSVAAQPRDGVLSSASLVRALSRALPFPAASDDGTPAGGSADPVWTVRWPEPDELRVEVVANPLNAKNREQALKVEREIQKAAMQSQSRSQGDYERAVSEFERTGRASGIREISLRDDGLAGERYDADSQLTITATTIGAAHEFAVSTATMPAISDSIPGAIVVRVAANAYEEPATGDFPGALHYCPEQAWVFFGVAGTPEIRRLEGAAVEVSLAAVRQGPPEHSMSVVRITGNPELVEQVLTQADWSVLTALIEG
jgi:hypothetical protein